MGKMILFAIYADQRDDSVLKMKRTCKHKSSIQCLFHDSCSLHSLVKRAVAGAKSCRGIGRCSFCAEGGPSDLP
ncbi:UNVERIFIED_CONTAM: hypothetical protein PYX00_010296 [Menopon gallinae]|uniref:Uncharacterized protein n=1 Tax=Menopon gallinae TaxID=328185 RepID=A0AAW2HFJ9_9NEOP